LQIAAVEKIRVSRIESILIRCAGLSSVIGSVPIIESVRQKKVDDLALTR
jgi:hypothetical protein